jgi:hypothetical protein
MSSVDEVILWKAPQPNRDPARELADGFDPQIYPGNGPYFTTVRAIAEDYQTHYHAGLQVIRLPRRVFQALIDQGIVVPDPLYAENESFHVPPAGLLSFNTAMQQGSQNEFQP